jgi:hypothetical protein
MYCSTRDADSYSRIETCIQKYRAGRKWDPKRQQIFDNYLTLGGISTGPKMFQGGVDVKKLPDDIDKEQIEQLKATDFLNHQDRKETGDEEDDWDVDFAFVVRGFLSYKVPYVLAYRKPIDLELACQTVRNFLNYVSSPLGPGAGEGNLTSCADSIP